jgi:hypothetical protein
VGKLTFLGWAPQNLQFLQCEIAQVLDGFGI